jgi:uncharacterized protein (UPF0276 family)
MPGGFAGGVGVMYNPAVAPLLRARPGVIDYLAITPDMFWTDRGPGAARRFVDLPAWVGFLDEAAGRWPLVAHSIGLSLGSVVFDDPGYVAQLLDWHRRYRFLWHSDHLSFARVTSAAGHDQHAGMAVPLPYDRDLLAMVTARLRGLVAAFPTAFLVENNVSYLRFPEEEMQEPEFLNGLVAGSGCGLLLDLHNLHVNAVNHGFDAMEFLAALDLGAVVEVHIAGGSEYGGFYTDSHAGACPEPVWALLDHVLARAPALRGVTFEFHDSYFPHLGETGLAAELGRARAAWQRARRVPA